MFFSVTKVCANTPAEVRDDTYNKVRARKKAETFSAEKEDFSAERETFSENSSLKTWLTANFSVTLHSKKSHRQTEKCL